MRITRDDVLTVSDVAALLDLKPYTVKEYARRGILPGRKLGRTWRFLRPELEEADQAPATSTGRGGEPEGVIRVASASPPESQPQKMPVGSRSISPSRTVTSAVGSSRS